MLLFLAFWALVLGESLASPQQQQQQDQQQQGCCRQETQSLIARLDALTRELRSLEKAFYTVHYARSFSTGSERLFVSNDREGNFVTANRTCIQGRGFLPSPKSEAENKALVRNLQREKKSAYLGHISAGYSNWAAGEPSSAKGATTCAKIDSDGKWRSTSCEVQLLIVCEFSFI